jgi:hypothetical protein
MATITGSKAFPTRTQTVDKEFRLEEERAFTLIIALDPVAGDTVSDALALCPPVGSGFLGFPNLWLSRRTPRQISRRLVEVDLEFTQRPPFNSPDQETTPNPVDWSIRWLGSSTEKLQRVLREDKDGNAIVMTNGEMYSTPVYENINILVTRYRKYFPIVQPALDEYLLEWNNSINSVSYRGKPKHTWLLSIAASPAQVNNFDVAELTYEFRYNPLTWIESRLQYGSYYLSGGNRIPFRDSEGNPTSWFLTDTGGSGSNTNPCYKEHHGTYAEKDFNTL